MFFALITFALTMTLMLGGYFAFVVRPEAQVAGRLRRPSNPDAPRQTRQKAS